MKGNRFIVSCMPHENWESHDHLSWPLPQRPCRDMTHHTKCGASASNIKYSYSLVIWSNSNLPLPDWTSRKGVEDILWWAEGTPQKQLWKQQKTTHVEVGARLKRDFQRFCSQQTQAYQKIKTERSQLSHPGTRSLIQPISTITSSRYPLRISDKWSLC